MEGELNPEAKTAVEELREAIANSAQAIDREFRRSANDWLSCFGSRIFIVETYLNGKEVEDSLSAETYQRALSRLEELKEKLFELKKQYPEKEAVPPDEIKSELLKSLDVLAE